MLELRFVRENPDVVKKAIKDRGMKLDVDLFLELDKKRRALLSEVEQLKHKRNITSDEIGKMLAKKQDVGALKSEMKAVSQKIKDLDAKVEEIDKKLPNLVLNIPNIPDKSVPIGPGDVAKKVIREWGKRPRLNFKLRNHIELGGMLGIIDFPRAAKITGSNFALFKGDGAKLQRALINYMLDLHTKKHGYKEIYPPYLVNRKSMIGTGQLPKLEQDMYRLKDDDYFLVPTAEVPLTNLHRDEVFNEKDLPIYYTAYTACFRREAGSYGKETKGLVRVHQFDKVELLKFVKPQNSYDELESLVKDAEEVLQGLGLCYRVALLSTEDLGFAASKCYDLEIWAAGLEEYLEVSSCSNFTDFQARRANIKYRRTTNDERRTTAYVHTLNGSGVALARLVISLIENNQRPDGSVIIPKALRPYMGKKVITPAKKCCGF